MLTTIAFDGDDTLWHNETLFAATQEKFTGLLTAYTGEDDIHERLYETERRNLRLFGYGIKGFTLSMIETALELTDRQIQASDIERILGWGKAMLGHPVEPLEGVREALTNLQGDYRLMVITKGDLFDQENKVARSGLADFFWRVEIVSEKDEATYRGILDRHDLDPETFLMVGNSLRSDIQPVLSLGSKAVHIEYEITWDHERLAVAPTPTSRFWHLDSMAGLPGLVRRIDAGETIMRT